MTQTKTRSRKKVLGTVAAVIVIVLLLLLAGAAFLLRCELSTLGSIEHLRPRNDDHLDGSVYTMHVKGGFYLDDFVAQGGLSSDGEIPAFLSGRVSRGLIQMSLDIPEISCSSFTAQTQDGHRLFARNYDFSKTNTCVVFTEANEGRHASVSSIDLQFLDISVDRDLRLTDKLLASLAAPYIPLDGMNDAGVACGIYMTYQGENAVPTNQTTDKPDFTSTTLLRMILDYADDLDEAVEIAQSYDLHDSAGTSFHYMVADASGRSAILEWVNGTDRTDNDGTKRELVVTYNDDDVNIGTAEGESDYQWITNFIIQPGYYDNEADMTGLDRYQRLYEELSKTDGVVADSQAAMDILAAVGRRNWNNDDANSCTVHSVVYDLTARTALWIPNENYGDESAVFTFAPES